MRFARISGSFFVFVSVVLVHADPGPLELWSPAPANSWNQEAYPVGNGKLAAMVFGKVTDEQIQFNEESIWTGQPNDYSNPNATPAHLASIRQKVFNRQDIWSEAQPFLSSVPLRQAQYQPAGVLNLNFSPHSGTSNYRRSLDLNTATATVRYDYGGVTYTREVFASAPDNVIVIRLTASQAAKISFTATVTTLQPDNTITTSGNELILNARVSVMPRPQYFATGLTNGIAYQARVRVLAEGGTVTTSSSSITVTNADAVTLLLGAASNYKKFDDLTANYPLICSNNVAAAATKSYAQLRAAQLDDYQSLFQRVVLDLGGTAKTNQPTGFRVKRAAEGDDPQLSTLYFQMGRYLMISGSRPGSLPLTLQGKWNETTNPEWESKHTLNINQQLNYSGAEMVNLSECHEPMFDMISDLSVTGAKVASNIYYSSGWVVHHNTDVWRGAAPINGRDGFWPAGQAWLAQNLLWHYQYTGDTNFLANTAYPLMKSAARFFQDFLIPHRDNTNWLVTNPSYSSEHNWKSGSIEVANVAGPTMDNELIRELCDYLIQSTHILGIDAEFRTNLINLRAKLPPNQIGRYGQLQEWLEDVDAQNDTHRHCSHLVGLYPGETISPYYTPTMAAAAKISTDARCSAPFTDIGWGHAWRIGLQARLQNSQSAYLFITNMLQRHVSTNLMFTDVNNRQCDGIFGALGGVTETMLQSQRGEIHLLPALPAKWTNGTVSGLMARGGFEVSIQWQSNRLASANILSKLGNTCRVRSRWPVSVKLGDNDVNAAMVLPGLWEFPTVAGSNYTVVPSSVAETEFLPSVTSPGDVHQTTTNLMFSGRQGTRLNADAPGDFVTYTVALAQGNYRIHIAADAGTNRGQFQLSAGPSGGALANLGAVNDTYSPTNISYLLATNAPPTNHASINFFTNSTGMLREFDCGALNVPSSGDYDFKFTVVDKNASSSGHQLVLDYVKFTPVADVTASNQPPTDIALSNSSIAENQPVGTVIGTFGSTDPDDGDTFTYTLASGDGDTDNAAFSVAGDTLQTAAMFDYETKNTYSLRVRSSDDGGLFVEKAFVINVTNVNEPPADISLSSPAVMENQPAGTEVGTLDTVDPDSGDTFTYTLVAGEGADDNAAFLINGQSLQTAASFDHETQPSRSVRVRSEDQGALAVEKIFVITVADTNEAPHAPSNVSPDDAAVDRPTTVTLQTSAFSDVDNADSHLASQWLVRKAADNSLVFDTGEDTGNKTTLVLPDGVLDYGTTYDWQARHSDAAGLWSDYSIPTTFSTVAPALTVSVSESRFIIAWPTNTDGFTLQYTTNFHSTDWQPVLPLPEIVDGFNVVTNALDGDAVYYRLQKP